jgi:hypothetical protein
MQMTNERVTLSMTMKTTDERVALPMTNDDRYGFWIGKGEQPEPRPTKPGESIVIASHAQQPIQDPVIHTSPITNGWRIDKFIADGIELLDKPTEASEFNHGIKMGSGEFRSFEVHVTNTSDVEGYFFLSVIGS